MKRITATLMTRTGWHSALALFLGALWTVLLVLQLFWFEDMPAELGVLLPASWSRSAIVIGAVVATLELFTVAYFLPLALSMLARWCVRVVALLIPLLWSVLLGYALLVQQPASVVYLGAKFDIPLSWLSITGMGLVFLLTLVVVVKDMRKS